MAGEEYFTEEEFDTEFNGKTVVRILRQGLVHWPYFFGYLLSVLATTLADGYLILLGKRLVDEGILAGDAEHLRRLDGAVRADGAGDLAGGDGVHFCASRLGERVQYDLRKAMFARLQALSLSYYDPDAGRLADEPPDV